jgi:hypothetical protein
MNEAALLRDSLKRLNDLQIEYYVTGSMASNYWGMPRSTHDLDFVIRMDPGAVNRLVDAFAPDFYIDKAAIEAAFSPPFQFNAIDTRSALKVDFWLPTPAPFDQEMLRRRVRKTVDGVPAWIATAEDVILHKLIWNRITPSDRQMKDVAGVWAVQKNALDMQYLWKWADELGLRDDLQKIVSEKIRPKNT